MRLSVLTFKFCQGTEELLKKETGIKDDDVQQDKTAQLTSEVSHALAAYKRYHNCLPFFSLFCPSYDLLLSLLFQPVQLLLLSSFTPEINSRFSQFFQ